MQLQAASIYGQLVPATRGEVPLTDVLAGGLAAVEVASGPEVFDCVGPVHTGATAISINNRAFTYVFSCTPIPAPGTLNVDFRALGKWYRLTDADATGDLTGEGAGRVDFNTGSRAGHLQRPARRGQLRDVRLGLGHPLRGPRRHHRSGHAAPDRHP